MNTSIIRNHVAGGRQADRNITRSNGVQLVAEQRMQGSPKQAGWLSIVLFVLWILAFADAAILQSRVFPNLSDQFVPAKIQANVVVATLGWLSQIAIGSAFFAFSLLLSEYLATPLSMLPRVACVAGIVAGVFLVAAGAGGQENVYVSVFYTPEQAGELARAIGTADLTVITATNNWVAGGFRSTSAYAQNWVMLLWSLTARKTRKLPRMLNWLGMIVALLLGLTVWIGPLTGPIAFIGLLIWHLWLGVLLVRSKPA
jgi:hypothetical protein